MKITRTLEQLTLVRIAIPLNIYSYYRKYYDVEYQIENKLTKYEALNLISFFVRSGGKYENEMKELYKFIQYETYSGLVQIVGV